MKELHPNVTCVPAYYKYCNGYFHAYGRVRQLSDHLRDLFTEPQKLIKAGAIADITMS